MTPSPLKGTIMLRLIVNLAVSATLSYCVAIFIDSIIETAKINARLEEFRQQREAIEEIYRFL